jgi:hypothetical protein
MGLRAFGLDAIKPYLPAKRVLSLSYPDLVMTQDELEAVTGIRTFAETDFGSWHGRDHKLPETEEAFRKLGTEEFRCVDIVASRGCEEVVDLNEPQELGSFDLVLDPGTTEHCANIWQATVNAANAVKVEGVIFHTPPLTMLNHGFFCPQPTFYHDLYTQNGWAIERMAATDGERFGDVPYTARFQLPPEMSLYVIARRLSPAPLTYPTQTKYLRNPALK